MNKKYRPDRIDLVFYAIIILLVGSLIGFAIRAVIVPVSVVKAKPFYIDIYDCNDNYAKALHACNGALASYSVGWAGGESFTCK